LNKKFRDATFFKGQIETRSTGLLRPSLDGGCHLLVIYYQYTFSTNAVGVRLTKVVLWWILRCITWSSCACGFSDIIDKNSDLDMNKSRQQQANGSDGNDKAPSSAAAPMSQISGVRRLQQSNSVVGIVPRFGVEIPNEQPLAEVSHCFRSSVLLLGYYLSGELAVSERKMK